MYCSSEQRLQIENYYHDGLSESLKIEKVKQSNMYNLFVLYIGWSIQNVIDFFTLYLFQMIKRIKNTIAVKPGKAIFM